MTTQALSQSLTIMKLEERIRELETRLTGILREVEVFVLPGAEEVKFTPFERIVIKKLFDARGRIVPGESIVDTLYGLRPVKDYPSPEIVKVYMCKIRRKLNGTGWEIRTHRGVGFTLIGGAYE